MQKRRKTLKNKGQLNLPLQEMLQFRENAFIYAIAGEQIEPGHAVTIKDGIALKANATCVFDKNRFKEVASILEKMFP